MQNYSGSVVQYETYKHQPTGEIFFFQSVLQCFFVCLFVLNTQFSAPLFSLDSIHFLLQLSQTVALQRTNVRLCIRSFTNLYKRKGKLPTVWSSPSPTSAREYKFLNFQKGYLQLILHASPMGYG